MYYEYWGLKKPPFDNVPDPAMYVDYHTSMENAIAETLFAIEEGNECVAVIVGDVGLGKTLSIRIIIDSLDQEKYRIALITNPDMTFIELVREIIGQLTGTQCLEKRRINLLETFNKLLFETIDDGKKVLIFIDEANAMSPANLESLRLLTNMQDDQRNLFTIVLAGQLELARRLEHPKRANLLQRVGTFSRIDKIESGEILKSYVDGRLKLAGGAKGIFTEDAYDFLWEYSEQGIPRLINKICKLSLKAGETNQFSEISGEVIRQIGERFQNLTGQAVQKRKPRKRSESEVLVGSEQRKPVESGALSGECFQERRHCGEPSPGETGAAAADAVGKGAQIAVPVVETGGADKMAPSFGDVSAPAVEASAEPASEEVSAPAVEASAEPASGEVSAPAVEAAAEPEPVAKDITKEVEIKGVKVLIVIPNHLIEQAKTVSPEQRLKIAGVLAAQVLKKQPEILSSPSVDPITLWSDIREIVAAEIR